MFVKWQLHKIKNTRKDFNQLQYVLLHTVLRFHNLNAHQLELFQ